MTDEEKCGARLLVVSIHDVAPSTRPAVERLVERLAEAGIRRYSLLVVPNYRGRERISDDARFVDWLHAMPQPDAEFVLHGYTHTAEALPRGPLRRLLATVYTNREGEFFACDAEEARGRLAAGLAEFGRCGLFTRGFVAPAWLLGPEAYRALRETELAYTTLLRHFVHLPTGRRYPAPACVYSVRADWRRAVSRRYNAAMARWTRVAPLVRLALHPADIEHPEIVEHAMNLARRLAQNRRLATYCDLLPAMEP